MRLRHAITGLSVLFAASPALAEVSDKIPSTGSLWGWMIVFNAVALALAAWRTFGGLAVIPLTAFNAWGGHEMVADPFVGPAILHEQGSAYITSVYVSGGAGVIGPALIVGLLWLIRRRSQTSQDD